MIDPGCAVTRESAAEAALGILRGDELTHMTTHLETCAGCREEVAGMLPMASRLLDLIPGTEPPLGFDRRVLSQMGQAGLPPARPAWRRHPALAAAAAAAAAVLIAVSAWVSSSGSGSPRPAQAQLVAEFYSHGHDVGRIETYGKPLWLAVSVRGVATSGAVTCEILHRDGSITTVGSFDLVGGSGSWSTPDLQGVTSVAGAQLVDPDGHVLAVALFS